MAKLPENFDAEQIEPVSFEVVPAGEYVAVITSSEMRETKDGQGRYLELCLKIIGDGPHKNRLVWDRLNLFNRSEKAESIAKATLSTICRSVKPPIMQPTDSSELHDKPLLIKVSVRPASEYYGESNEVKAYKPVTGDIPTGTNKQSTVDGQPSAKMPWERK